MCFFTGKLFEKVPLHPQKDLKDFFRARSFATLKDDARGVSLIFLPRKILRITVFPLLLSDRLPNAVILERSEESCVWQ